MILLRAQTLDTVIVYGPERSKRIPDGFFGDPDMQLLHAAASCCKRLNHLNIVISNSASPGGRGAQHVPYILSFCLS